MGAQWQRVSAVVRLELRTQRREPLTALYMIVFFLLAAAFAAAGPVELVRGRGSVPRDSAWSIMLASSALTAFGQVITTMVAATVVLRDRADRVDELLRATALRPREYLTGKLLASLGLLCAIYAAIPLGLVCGAVIGGGSAWRAGLAAAGPFLFVVVPTMLAVGAIQFGLGAISGRLWVIVGQGLLLIWLWSSAIDIVSHRGGEGWVLLDPFASAPLLRASASWTDVQRATESMPVTSGLLWNRALWLIMGAVVAGVAIIRAQRAVQSPRRAHAAGSGPETPMTVADGVTSLVISTPAVRPAYRSPAAIASYVTRWMLRDTGWRVLAVLGTLNVTVHVVVDTSRGMSPTDLSAVLVAAMALHARLFLILLATIYAGEIVWREREDRTAGLFDALPVSDGDVVMGRIVGVVVAQGALVIAMAAVVAATGALRSGSTVAVGVFVRGVWAAVVLPFVSWMLLALGVHVVVQQKVVAHLLCIVGWMTAVWLGGAAGPALADAAWSRVVAVPAAGMLAWLGWVRGVRLVGRARWSEARRRAVRRFVLRS
jgi:ABC-type transport system involved in multi-copper enzyme maturation permease subunit